LPNFCHQSSKLTLDKLVSKLYSFHSKITARLCNAIQHTKYIISVQQTFIQWLTEIGNHTKGGTAENKMSTT